MSDHVLCKALQKHISFMKSTLLCLFVQAGSGSESLLLFMLLLLLLLLFCGGQHQQTEIYASRNGKRKISKCIRNCKRCTNVFHFFLHEVQYAWLDVCGCWLAKEQAHFHLLHSNKTTKPSSTHNNECSAGSVRLPDECIVVVVTQTWRIVLWSLRHEKSRSLVKKHPINML